MFVSEGTGILLSSKLTFGFWFSLGLKESAEQMVKNKLEGNDQLTPWEKYLQKQKEKRKIKKRKKVIMCCCIGAFVSVNYRGGMSLPVFPVLPHPLQAK